MLWFFDAIALLIAFAISPVAGFVWLIINVVYIVVQLVNRSNQNDAAVQMAYLAGRDSALLAKSKNK